MNARKAPQFPRWPQYDDAERDGLIRALEQGQWWRMGGDEVASFEREFAAHHGAAYALAVTNGTHALELALQCMGVGPGTEVIVPAFTFISSSQAAQRLGAVAVPVDVHPDTYCIDATAVAAAVTPRTTVIMPVHMAGLMADMDALAKISAETGVPLLQDAAHAHGARWQGKRVGELDSVAAFSFQNGKLMTAGEGGAVLFPDEAMYENAFVRHSCGRPREDRRYFHKTAGTNMRLNEFSASVLRAQLRRLDAQIEIRDERWTLLARLLGAIDGVVPQGGDVRADRNSHYMAMFRIPGIGEERRNALVDALVEAGLPAFAAFRAIYRTEAFWETGAPDETLEEIAERCPHTDAISADGIWLHHRVLLAGEEEMHATAEIIADVVGRGMSVRVALVGLGWAGRDLWFPRLRDHAGFDVVAAVDADPASRAAFATATGIAVFPAVDALTTRAVDLAVVAVPNYLHTEVAGALVANGVAVFLEKPVCLTSAEVDLLAAAERSGGMLLAGSAARHRGDVEALCRVLPDLGRIRHVDLGWVRARGVPRAGGWFTRRDMAGGGALFDLGWHLLDTLAFLLGPARFTQVIGVTSDDFVNDVSARAAWRQDEPGADAADVEDTARGFLVRDDGVSVSLRASWASHEARDVSSIRVEGSAGTAELRCTFGFSPDREPEPVLTVNRAGTTTRLAVPAERIGVEYTRQLDGLAAMLADPDSRGRAIAEARPIVSMIESFYASAAHVRPAVPAYQ